MIDNVPYYVPPYFRLAFARPWKETHIDGFIALECIFLLTVVAERCNRRIARKEESR